MDLNEISIEQALMMMVPPEPNVIDLCSPVRTRGRRRRLYSLGSENISGVKNVENVDGLGSVA